MKFTIRLGLIAAAMTAFLGFLVVSHAVDRATGTEVVLDVRGYDPRDLFLGHFSLIATDLQRLDTTRLEGDNAFRTGDPVYVVLAQDSDGGWQAVSLHQERPDARPFIHGSVLSSYSVDERWMQPQTDEPSDEAQDGAQDDAQEQAEPVRRLLVNAVFNIERYYASRELAQEFDRRLREVNADGGNGVRLILSLPASGDAIIKGFEIDGERQIDRLW